jgi:hypothetical protein
MSISQEILELRQKHNYNIRQIARKIGRRDTFVVNVLKSEGFYFKKNNKGPIPNDVAELIIKDYKSGLKLNFLIKKYKLRADLIKKTLSKVGLFVLPKKHNSQTEEKIKNLYKNSTLTIKDICKTLGVTPKVLHRCCLGIKRNHKPTIKYNRRSTYDIWVDKYGIELANAKLKLYKKKLSLKSKGENNPMFGKPAPQGSGNGWKGWYKDKFFRSLKELSFMAELDSKNVAWKSAEYISIPYKFMESNRTYHPDFICGHTIYEIKPLRLINSPNVSAKTKAAKEWCKKHSYSFKIKDVKILSTDKIKQFISDGSLKFQEKYKEKINLFLAEQEFKLIK